jgi:cysteine desulfurase / selenocysteine lyase
MPSTLNFRRFRPRRKTGLPRVAPREVKGHAQRPIGWKDHPAGTILVGEPDGTRTRGSMPPTIQESHDLELIREREFAGVTGGFFLNVASFGPLPERGRRAMERMMELRTRPHTLSEPELGALMHRTRAAAAALVGAGADEIALASSTSHGINLAARGLPLPAGSTVLISDREFPANVYPWMALAERGVRLEMVPAAAGGWPDEPRILERLEGGDIACLAVSSVQFASGYRMDLETLGRTCRERGIFFVVDAIQSLGCLPLDVRRNEIDVLATSGHKWLCGPFGCGFAYVRRELQERLAPTFVGWGGLEASADLSHLLDYRLDFHPDGRRFEGGTPPFEALAGFAESLELLAAVGPELIERHVAEVLEPLFAWLDDHPDRTATDTSSERRSGIVALAPPDVPSLHVALTRAGVTCALREDAVRIAAHLFNTRDEVERVLEVLEAADS